jgi:hypothetical protein
MADVFDPYHKWLGIPSSEQPANHYRLLGVAIFEQDADVIDSAANQRMSYLQDMATGPHVEDSQRILNEISSARLCLLNVQRKSQYDSLLKSQIDKATAANSPAETAPAAETPTANSPIMLVSAISIGVITLTVALFLVWSRSDDTPKDEDMGTLFVVWKVDEREGAHVMIGSKVVIDSKTKKLPPEATVSFKVKPSAKRIQFTFERKGHREIEFYHKFIPGEEVKIEELRWRKR